MVQAMALLAAASLLGVGSLMSADLDFRGRDCQPFACLVGDGALRLCASPFGPVKRMVVERLDPPRPTYLPFIWNPGSLGPMQELRVSFRHGEDQPHVVTFDPGAGLVRTSGGLPPAEARFPFGLRDHAVEVVHSHALKVYVDGVDEAHLVLDLPLAAEDQLATAVVLEVTDDGACHRFPEVGGVPYAFDCPAGRCELDTAGLQLCGWGTDQLVWRGPVSDGTFSFDWDPTSFGVASLTVFLRADAPPGERHGVSFDLVKDGTLRFTEGLEGLPLPVDVHPGALHIRVTHGHRGLEAGEVQVYVDEGLLPAAVAVYGSPEDAATQLAFEAQGFGGCQWIGHLGLAR